MRVFYCDQFVLPLPEGHRFPMAKYRLLRERLVDEAVVARDSLHVPEPAGDEQILRVHSRRYLELLLAGQLGSAAMRRIGFPWSLEMIERSRRSVGGTIGAARAALEEGASVNLAGGTHHATADAGAGFCVLNDVAIAARELQADGAVQRVLVVDCDVHQGDGTALVFADDPTVFTFSIHGRNNYPYRKRSSDLDVALDDGTADEEYLRALEPGLIAAIEASRPEIAFYIAGADPFVEDRWGRMALTLDGLGRRDDMVFEHLEAARVPVAVVMGGGYAPDVSRIVTIHARTVARAARSASRGAGRGAGRARAEAGEGRV